MVKQPCIPLANQPYLIGLFNLFFFFFPTGFTFDLLKSCYFLCLYVNKGYWSIAFFSCLCLALVSKQCPYEVRNSPFFSTFWSSLCIIWYNLFLRHLVEFTSALLWEVFFFLKLLKSTLLKYKLQVIKIYLCKVFSLIIYIKCISFVTARTF